MYETLRKIFALYVCVVTFICSLFLYAIVTSIIHGNPFSLTLNIVLLLTCIYLDRKNIEQMVETYRHMKIAKSLVKAFQYRTNK